jgi:hypothetical protein
MASGTITRRMIAWDEWKRGARGALLYLGAAVLSIVYCYSRLPEIKYRGFAISLLFANKVSARKFKSTVVDRTSPFLALLH